MGPSRALHQLAHVPKIAAQQSWERIRKFCRVKLMVTSNLKTLSSSASICGRACQVDRKLSFLAFSSICGLMNQQSITNRQLSSRQQRRHCLKEPIRKSSENRWAIGNNGLLCSLPLLSSPSVNQMGIVEERQMAMNLHKSNNSQDIISTCNTRADQL